GPDQIAINDAGTFLWVTGSNNGSVTTYSINGGTGLLTQGSKLTGFVHPLGIAVDSTNSIVYIADNGAGLVYSFSINSTNGALTQIGSPVQDIGGPGGGPGFISIDPGFNFIYVTDLTFGVLSVLATNSGALLFSSIQPAGATANMPIGVGFAVLSNANFVFAANQGDSTLWSFQLTGPGNPQIPVAFGSGDVSAPTGLVVDPQNAFLYTTNQTTGTVSQFSLNPTCSGAVGPPCFVQSVATESPHNASSGPFGITLAQ
ncbi:MAG TPA: beta-propeller fold lactonase family protein, partial [Candidatus Binatus sp.]|nr:beta-propeller fold lactonase family protein [Candidatus Binatus sp.]